jgi:hypothetical protein
MQSLGQVSFVSSSVQIPSPQIGEQRFPVHV